MLQRDGKSIVAIGCVSGVDKDLHKLIKEVLHGRGIWSTYEGSMMYDIFVHTDDEGDAREILRTDPRLAGKQIMALP